MQDSVQRPSHEEFHIAEKERKLSAAGQRRRHQQIETEADDFLDGITIEINAEEEPLADTNYYFRWMMMPWTQVLAENWSGKKLQDEEY